MYSDQRHMIIAGLDKPVDLTIDRDANRENVSSDFVAVRAWIARSTLPVRSETNLNDSSVHEGESTHVHARRSNISLGSYVVIGYVLMTTPLPHLGLLTNRLRPDQASARSTS
jgi:hypothetical protein